MLLSEYQAQLAEVICRYARTDLIIASELNTDARTPKIGVVRGFIAFCDGSQLFSVNMLTHATAWKSSPMPIISRILKAT